MFLDESVPSELTTELNKTSTISEETQYLKHPSKIRLY